MDENAAEIVATCEVALTHLTEKGWVQDAYTDLDTDAACLAGAIVIAKAGWRALVDEDNAFRAALHCPAVRAVARTIIEIHPQRCPGHSGAGPHTVYCFNDHPETTREDVIDVVQKTIKRYTDETVETP